MKETGSNLFALLQFGSLQLLVLGNGFYTYFKSGDFLLTDFVVKEPHVCEVRCHDSIWLGDHRVWESHLGGIAQTMKLFTTRI